MTSAERSAKQYARLRRSINRKRRAAYRLAQESEDRKLKRERRAAIRADATARWVVFLADPSLPSWPERIENCRVTFDREPYLTWCTAGGRPWLYGVWMLNAYEVLSGYYGGYPGDYLERIRALFPERRNILHVCSGKVDLSIMPGDTLDILPERNPTYCTDAQTMEGVPLDQYDLVLADPPYSQEHAKRYHTSMPDRGRIMTALEGLRPGVYVVWLDERVPKYSGAAFTHEGIIGLSPSTGRQLARTNETPSWYA